MCIHVLVVGHRPQGQKRPNDSEIDAIGALVDKYAFPHSPEFFVETCEAPEQLIPMLRKIATQHGLIDTLDLYDHGAGGSLLMGNALLFHSADAASTERAAELRPFLAKGARLRLLGCDTARGEAGQNLLMRLHDVFEGDVTVYGTIAGITLSQFDEYGFRRKYFEELYLYSSHEALRDVQLQKVAPSFDERDRAIMAWGEQQRQLLGPA